MTLSDYPAGPAGWLPLKKDYLVRKRGLEPLSLSAPAPKAGVFAISPLPHSSKFITELQLRPWPVRHRREGWVPVEKC